MHDSWHNGMRDVLLEIGRDGVQSTGGSMATSPDV